MMGFIKLILSRAKTNVCNLTSKNNSFTQIDLSVDIIDSSVKALSCQDGGLGLFRLLHLLDAASTINNFAPKLIYSVGSGKGYHEIIMASIFPEAEVCAIDLEVQQHEFSLPNLKNIRGDITNKNFLSSLKKADFVFSIECLEHVKEDKRAFLSMASLVARDGYFYIELPYATDWERNDAETRHREFQTFGHYTPGYDVRQLEEMANLGNMTPVYIKNIFWAPLQPMLWAAVDKFGSEIIHRYTRELIELLILDFKDELAIHRGQSTGIKMLASMEARGDCT